MSPKRLTLTRTLPILRPPAICITFDDGGSTQYSEGYAYMSAAGLRGTLYVPKDLIDTTGFVTTANLTTMYNAGWDIGNHGTDGTVFTTLGQAAIETRLTTVRDWLNGLGFTRASRHVAYPGGGTNSTVEAAMDATDMLTGRTTVEAMEVVRYHGQYDISAYIIDKTKTLAQATALIDTAISDKKILIVYIHNINSSPGTDDVSTATFEGFIDYVVSSGIRAITISEYYDRLTST